MDEPIVLHREDICAKSGAFKCLSDSSKNRLFQEDLLRFIAASDFRAFAVVIDKSLTQNRHYGLSDANPYHISLAIMLERYCGWLRFSKQVGDVLAEGRGGREDKQLKAAYQAVCNGGARYFKPEFFSSILTTSDIKIKAKSADVPGLQLADLLAYAAKRRILEEQDRAKPLTGFEKEVADLLESKYNRHSYDGRIVGYGKIFLK